MRDAFAGISTLLTYRVRYAHPDQLLPFASAPALSRMVASGFLSRVNVLVRWPLLELREPLDTWSVGEPRQWRGDPDKIAYRAQRRWRDVGAQLQPVYMATPRLAKVTGGVATGEVRAAHQVTHDLHVTECFRLMTEEAQEAWLGEDALRADGWAKHQTVPDAIITRGAGRVAIEFGGQYDAERIREFQDFCYWEGLSYLLF